MERLSLTYLYRLPPIYNEKMTKSSINILSFAPLFALSILMWQYTNKQMFDNQIDKVLTQDQITFSHHNIKDLFIVSKLSLSQKLLLASFILSVTFTLIYKLKSNLSQWFKNSKLNINFQKNLLPNYFNALRFNDLEEFIQEEQEYEKFGFNIFTPECIK